MERPARDASAVLFLGTRLSGRWPQLPSSGYRKVTSTSASSITLSSSNWGSVAGLWPKEGGENGFFAIFFGKMLAY